MATYTPLTLEQAQRVGDRFGVGVAEVVAVPAGSVNSNYRLVLSGGASLFPRIYEEQRHEGAEGEARLLDPLPSNGVATARPFPPAAGTGFTLLPRAPAGHA